MLHRYNYILTAFIVLMIITLISMLCQDYLELVNIALIHLIPIIVVALRGNFYATALIALIAILFFNVLYVHTKHFN